MTTKIVYHSQTGNTKKVAEAIAESLSCQAETIEKATITEPIDLLFIGAAVYATYDHGFSPEVQQFISKLSANNIKRVAIFGTYAFGSSIEKLRQLLVDHGLIVESEKFSCKGRFLFFNWKAPTHSDLLNAQAFARKIAGA